jgi:predicted cupin superfamily sugar epimerase
MPNPAQFYIQHYQMQAHPEGGYFAETYRSTEKIPQNALPSRFKDDRSFATGIYFLLESHHISALHRIESDEMWHFYAGCPLHVYVIDAEGKLEIIRLGNNPEKGEVFQAVVPAGKWFGSKPAEENSYSLVGCTVAPGFDFEDFEMKSREELLTMFPQHEQIVKMLTY